MEMHSMNICYNLGQKPRVEQVVQGSGKPSDLVQIILADETYILSASLRTYRVGCFRGTLASIIREKATKNLNIHRTGSLPSLNPQF